jgi:hypothetical protein
MDDKSRRRVPGMQTREAEFRNIAGVKRVLVCRISYLAVYRHHDIEKDRLFLGGV